MSVLSVQAVARRYADRVVFRDVSLRLAQGDRAGLVGPNGCGKSSLLRIAARIDEPDLGNVAIARAARVGFLPQEALLDVKGTVLQYARGASAHLRELEAELRAMEGVLGAGDAATLERYSDAQHHFEHAGGYDFDSVVTRVLAGLGLDGLADRDVRTLSGGEGTRLGLARVLLDDPDVLLLDEPTNHLDLAALEWLEKFLVERDSTVLVASHDRWFLDKVTSRTLSFEPIPTDPTVSTVVEYRGGYSKYARQRAERDVSVTRAAAKQAEEVARTEDFIDRFRAGQRSKEARGRAKKLARLERIQAPVAGARHGWRLEAAHLASDAVLETTALAVGHRKRIVLRTPPLRIARGARVAVIGPNGAGKTTLARTLVGELKVIEGYARTAPTARIAFLAQTQDELRGEGSVMDAITELGLGEQAARDLLARFLFRGEDVFRAQSALSGGERSRLALARLALREANLLVLDEPTNHLDLLAREALETVLSEYEGTLLVVSHDRYFVDRLASEIWFADRGELHVYEGNWSSFKSGTAIEKIAPDIGSSFGPGTNKERAGRRNGALGSTRSREGAVSMGRVEDSARRVVQSDEVPREGDTRGPARQTPDRGNVVDPGAAALDQVDRQVTELELKLKALFEKNELRK